MTRQATVNRTASRRRIPLWLWLVAATAIAIVGLLAFYLLRPLEGPVPENVGAHYVGIPQGFTPQGFPRLGDPDAPLVIENFSSYACPHCRELHENQLRSLLSEVAAGRIQLVMFPVPHIGRGADTAAKAAFCAGEQGRYWDMNDVLFYWQDKYLTSIFDRRRIDLGAENLGLDVEAFDACMGSDLAEAFIDTAQAEFSARGLSGTPSLFLNGERVRDYREIESLIPSANAAVKGGL